MEPTEVTLPLDTARSRKAVSRAWVWWLLTAIFLASFLIRVYNPVGRSPVWVERTAEFAQALRDGNWSGTYLSRHPGVTPMIVATLGRSFYYRTETTPINLFYDWITPGSISKDGLEYDAGLVALVFAISVSIVLCVWVLQKISSWTVALTAGGMLAFAPFFVAHSRDYHVDALFSILMVLSGLLILAYGQLQQKRYLLASGFVAGWAILSKSPAVFLFPFAGLMLLVYLAISLRREWADHAEDRARWLLLESWRGLVMPLGLWLVMMAIPFAAWPAMWVHPRLTIIDLFFKTEERILNPHPGARYLFGTVYSAERPLWVFYLVTFAFKASYLTLVLLMVGVLVFTIWRKKTDLPVTAVNFWLMISFIVFFMIEMTIGAKQVARYILPAHGMSEVVAGVAAAGIANLLRPALKHRARWALAVPVLAVALSALQTIWFMPDPGAIHNSLLGGNRVAVKVMEISDMNEGSYQIGQALTNIPPRTTILIPSSGFQKGVRRYVELVRHRYDGVTNPNYVIFVQLDFQRGDHAEEWGDPWLILRNRTAPDVVVHYDGVDFAYLYNMNSVQTADATVYFNRDGIVFIVLAWVWFAGLLVAGFWASSQVKQSPP